MFINFRVITNAYISQPTNDDGGPLVLSLFSTISLSHLTDPSVNAAENFAVQVR